MLFFGGYGVQSGHESYMIPTDATIWKESDVRHEGMSVETVLARLRHADCIERCPLSRVTRKTCAHAEFF